MPATFCGVFGSSHSGSRGAGGLTVSEVKTLLASSQLHRGVYDAQTTYSKFQAIDLDQGFAISRVDANLGNNPLTDDGSNWILVMNGNRMTEWYGRNQTEELPTGRLANNQTVTSQGVIGFTGTAGGDESENGGVPGITLVDISAVANADPTVSLANSGISFPAGRYEILAGFYGNQPPDEDVHIRMMEVMTNVDDIARLVGTQRQRNFIGTHANDVHAHYEMLRKFRVTSPTTFYFQLVNYGSNKNRIVGYVQIDRIA